MAFEGKEELAPRAERSERGEARIESEAATERRLEVAGRLGEEIGAYEERFAALEAEAASLPDGKRAEVMAAVAAEQRKVLAERGSAFASGKADAAMAFKEEDLKRDRAELTALRVENSMYAVGASIAAGFSGASKAALERGVTPFLEASRGALKQMSEAAAETIDKVSPSVVRAIEDAVRKVGTAGAEAGGKALMLAAQSAGKLIEHAGGAAWQVAERIVEKAPAAVARGLKAMVMAFKNKG